MKKLTKTFKINFFRILITKGLQKSVEHLIKKNVWLCAILTCVGPIPHSLESLEKIAHIPTAASPAPKGQNRGGALSKLNCQVIVIIWPIWWFLEYLTHKELWKALTYSWESKRPSHLHKTIYTYSGKAWIGVKLSLLADPEALQEQEVKTKAEFPTAWFSVGGVPQNTYTESSAKTERLIVSKCIRKSVQSLANH